MGKEIKTVRELSVVLHRITAGFPVSLALLASPKSGDIIYNLRFLMHRDDLPETNRSEWLATRTSGTRETLDAIAPTLSDVHMRR